MAKLRPEDREELLAHLQGPGEKQATAEGTRRDVRGAVDRNRPTPEPEAVDGEPVNSLDHFAEQYRHSRELKAAFERFRVIILLLRDYLDHRKPAGEPQELTLSKALGFNSNVVLQTLKRIVLPLNPPLANEAQLIAILRDKFAADEILVQQILDLPEMASADAIQEGLQRFIAALRLPATEGLARFPMELIGKIRTTIELHRDQPDLSLEEAAELAQLDLKALPEALRNFTVARPAVVQTPEPAAAVPAIPTAPTRGSRVSWNDRLRNAAATPATPLRPAHPPMPATASAIRILDDDPTPPTGTPNIPSAPSAPEPAPAPAPKPAVPAPTDPPAEGARVGGGALDHYINVLMDPQACPDDVINTNIDYLRQNGMTDPQIAKALEGLLQKHWKAMDAQRRILLGDRLCLLENTPRTLYILSFAYEKAGDLDNALAGYTTVLGRSPKEDIATLAREGQRRVDAQLHPAPQPEPAANDLSGPPTIRFAPPSVMVDKGVEARDAGPDTLALMAAGRIPRAPDVLARRVPPRVDLNDHQEVARRMAQALASYGVQGQFKNIIPGPQSTLYEFAGLDNSQSTKNADIKRGLAQALGIAGTINFLDAGQSGNLLIEVPNS